MTQANTTGASALLADRYRLDDLLEDNDGARFWRAFDLILGRDVAIHVVPDDDPRAAALIDAARASATAPETHLLRVLDAVSEQGSTYVVHEWGSGISLDAMLADDPLPPRQAAWLVREVAGAITETHLSGIAHGRLLPENVLVNEIGQVKLIGFVIDRVLHGRDGGEHVSEHESDVRNLAALLYAALTGRWPGSAGSAVPAAPLEHGRVLRARQVRAGVPKQLDQLCDVALNGPPGGPSSDGYAIETAHEIRAALADYLGEATESVNVGRAELPVEDPEATQFGLPVFDGPVFDGPAISGPVFDDRDTPPEQPPRPTPIGIADPLPHRPLHAAPPQWGPDAPDYPGYSGYDEYDHERHLPWIKAGLVFASVLAVVILGVMTWQFLMGDDDAAPPAEPAASDTPAPATPVVVPIASVKDFDPYSDNGQENPDQTPQAVDGDPATAWLTSTYKDGPDITVYKPGVGLLLDLGAVLEVGKVHVELVGEPSNVQLFASTQEPGSPDDMEAVDVNTAAGTSVDLVPSAAVQARYLVVWFTGLPEVKGGYQGGVAEVSVTS